MYEPSPVSPELKQGALQAQGAEARSHRLKKLEQDLLASIPAESLLILAKAFSISHGKQGWHTWPQWVAASLKCPVTDIDIDQLGQETRNAAGEK
jgi:hypothetical protein